MDLQNLTAVVLAGGKGTRMKSDTPKVLHSLGDQPMVFVTLQKLKDLGISDIKVVVGHKADEVRDVISAKFNVDFVLQPEPLGTGHALDCALQQIPNSTEILVVNGDDSAFYKIETLIRFMQSHTQTEAVVSMITLQITRDSQLGRVIRNESGEFEQILESKEYLVRGLHSDEINCGAYLFDYQWVRQNSSSIPLSEKGEYYITELLNIAKAQSQKINLFQIQDEREWVGINTQEELQFANSLIHTP